jgi:hypothetical protein
MGKGRGAKWARIVGKLGTEKDAESASHQADDSDGYLE